MPILMTMQWDGVTAEQYEQVRKEVHGDRELHGDGKVTYRDQFTQAAEQDWDEAHAKK